MDAGAHDEAVPQGILPLPRNGPKTWFDRNWKWFVPLLVVGALSCVAVFVLGIIVLATGIVKSSYPYQFAIQQASKSERVAEQIGRPFKVGWIKSGNVNYEGAAGEANLTIPIRGNKGKGEIIVAAKRREGKWTFETLELDVVGQDQPIPLLSPEPAPAPASSPNSS